MVKQLLKSAGVILGVVVVVVTIVMVIIWWFVTQPTFTHNARSAKHVDLQRLRHTVLVLSEDYAPRNFRHVENLNKCAAYIKEQFVKAGAVSTTFQRFSAAGNDYVNVRAFFGNQNEKRLVIGAHYDAFDTTPGADDNASGVAGLIELAYLLGRYPVSGGVELVAYALEEPPFYDTSLMGSAYHADRLVEEGISVSLMISLEMIGYFTDQPGSQGFPIPFLRLFYPGTGNFLAVVGCLDQRRFLKMIKSGMRGATDLPIYSFCAPTVVPGIDYSDHRNYWKHGYPAVMVTDTAFYRNTAYHGAGDTAGRLDYERMAQVVISVYEAVAAFQQGDRQQHLPQ